MAHDPLHTAVADDPCVSRRERGRWWRRGRSHEPIQSNRHIVPITLVICAARTFGRCAVEPRSRHKTLQSHRRIISRACETPVAAEDEIW